MRTAPFNPHLAIESEGRRSTGPDAEARGEAELAARRSRAAAIADHPSHEKTKRRGENILKTFKKQKNKVACNPDSGRAVVLGAPRSAFLADFQPAGAPNSLQGLKSKNSIKHPQKHLHVHIGAWGISIYRVSFSFLVFL
jgi:hypothetical protein